jgi:4-amino-4-deoxy-L-arabinose transferase-like glycosyltransferase
MNRRKIAFIIFIASSALFLAGLHNTEFIRINCRFGLFIHEMAENPLGPFPLLYGVPYCDYLSIHTYLMYLASLLGGVTMLTATLPSALAAGGVMSFTYLIGARKSNKFGLLAVLMLTASYEFLCIARAPSPDMFVAFSTICAFYLMYTSELDNKAVRLFFLPLLFVLGFVMRGPIGAVIPIGVVFVYYLTAYRWKTAVAGGVLGTLVLACCLMLLIMIIYQYGGKELLKTFEKLQFNDRMSKGKPVWFYFTNAMGSYALAYPLAFFVMGTYAWIERKKYFAKVSSDSYAALRQRLTGWLLVIVLGMSIPGTKHLRYIVPALPAAALLAAFLFADPDRLPLFKKVRELFLKLCRITPFAALLTVVVGAIVLKILKLNVPIPMFLPAILFLVLGFAMVGGMRKIKGIDKMMFTLALTAMTFLVIKIMLIEPIENYSESSYKFVNKIESFRPDNSKICFCGKFQDGEALKYLINLPREKYFIPIFIEDYGKSEELLKLPVHTLIVFKSSETKHIKPEVRKRLKELAQGELGHRECTLFRLTK